MLRLTLSASLVLTLGTLVAVADPVGSGFRFNGQLAPTTLNLGRSVDMQFSLWDAGTGGNQIGATQQIDDVALELLSKVVDGMLIRRRLSRFFLHR